MIVDPDDDKIFAVMEFAPGGAVMDDLDGEHLRSTSPDALIPPGRAHGRAGASPCGGGGGDSPPAAPRTARKYEKGDRRAHEPEQSPNGFASPAKRMRLPLPEVRNQSGAGAGAPRRRRFACPRRG